MCTSVLLKLPVIEYGSAGIYYNETLNYWFLQYTNAIFWTGKKSHKLNLALSEFALCEYLVNTYSLDFEFDNFVLNDKFANLTRFYQPFFVFFYPFAMHSCAIFLTMNTNFLIFHFFVLVGSQWNWFQTHHWAQYCHTGIQANFEIHSKLSKVWWMKSFRKVFYLDFFFVKICI